jgi:uncharacterized protein YciI
MQFLMIGLLKEEAGPIPQDVQQQTNEFLGQPLMNITTAGELRNERGERAGMMIIVECADRAGAEDFLKNSPYLQARLYGEVRIFEYQPEVGAL